MFISMKKINTAFILFFILSIACGSSDSPLTIDPKPDVEVKWTFNHESLSFSHKGGTESVIVTASDNWTVTSNKDWCSVSPTLGYNGQTSLKITASSNHTEASRSAELNFVSGEYNYQYEVTQEAGKIDDFVPSGYTLKWQEEFNETKSNNGKPILPNTDKWWYENFTKGTVNNELQTYVGGFSGTDTVAYISDGTLKIVAKKQDAEVISARINTSESWTYGYFEARLKVPCAFARWNF